MYIKIYFNDKPLFLCDKVDETIEPWLHHDDAVFIDELDPHTVKSMIHEMEQEKIHAGVFFHPDLEALKKAFYKKFLIIQAAGGMVQNGHDEVLMIYRKGKWDMPKGKLDPGENLETCALREVEEETGLQSLALLGPLTITYHTYHEGTKFILKESHWYRMLSKNDTAPVPQEEEGITEIRWVPVKDLSSYFDNAYPSIRDVLKAI